MDDPSVIEGNAVDSSFGGSIEYSNKIKNLEDELKYLANSLSTKANQATIEEIQFKIAPRSGGEGGVGGDNALQDESTMKDLMDKINAVNNSVVALAERSDLAVLLAKRAEQIAHPAAIIHGENGHTNDEEIQSAVNEHANRIMVYADMLLQMQVVLATKADNSALSALREIVEKMQAEGGGASKEALGAQEKLQEQMNNTIKSHEKMLLKILEDVGLLGKGVLIMSGHDDEFHPDNIPSSPEHTISTQGAIPSAPWTPNSIPGEGGARTATTEGAKSPTSSVSNLALPFTPPSGPPLTPHLGPPSAPPFAPPIVPALALPPTLTTDSSGVFNTPTSPSTKLDAKTVPSSANWKPSGTSSRKTSRFGSPGSTVRQGSASHITNVQEASQVVADSTYHDTLAVLEDAINSKKIEPKENVADLKQLVLEIEKISLELENYLILIDNLEQNKVDKIDFQSLAKIVKELKAMENAMLSSKPILGFKCMSCNHDLERLSPTRGPQIPTNQMPRSFLSMLSAERIFSLNKQDISPMCTPPQILPTSTQVNEYGKTLKKTRYYYMI